MLKVIKDLARIVLRDELEQKQAELMKAMGLSEDRKRELERAAKLIFELEAAVNGVKNGTGVKIQKMILEHMAKF